MTATHTSMTAHASAGVEHPTGLVDKARLLAAAAVAIALLRSIGWMVAAPADPQMAITFTLNGTQLVTVLPPLLVLVVVAASVGAVIAGPRWPEGGAFAASLGLAALALKAGSMHVVLAYYAGIEAGTRRLLMIAMGLDTACWTLILAAAWIAGWTTWRWLWPEAARDRLPAFSRKADKEAVSHDGYPGWLALIVTTVVALFIIWMTIARTPVAMVARGQAIASVAGGLYLGALAARHFTGVNAPEWYALAAPIVGGVGYLMGYLQANMSWATGPWADYASLATTAPHALARPLPVEYLAVGVAAALVGFWGGRKTEHTTGPA